MGIHTKTSVWGQKDMLVHEVNYIKENHLLLQLCFKHVWGKVKKGWKILELLPSFWGFASCIHMVSLLPFVLTDTAADTFPSDHLTSFLQVTIKHKTSYWKLFLLPEARKKLKPNNLSRAIQPDKIQLCLYHHTNNFAHLP